MDNELDYECSICLMLMIRPVTLPCKHDMCLNCFEATYFPRGKHANNSTKNVSTNSTSFTNFPTNLDSRSIVNSNFSWSSVNFTTNCNTDASAFAFIQNKCNDAIENNIKCPFCQQDIKSWLARDKSPDSFVDQTKWSTIQRLFPQKVAKYEQRNIMNSVDCDSDDEGFKPVVTISEEGSIRKEYEEDLRKLEEERELRRKKEEEESAAILEMFRKEDEQARQNIRPHFDTCDDLESVELALKLMEEFHKEDVTISDVQFTGTSIMKGMNSDNKATHPTDPWSTHQTMSPYKSINNTNSMASKIPLTWTITSSPVASLVSNTSTSSTSLPYVSTILTSASTTAISSLLCCPSTEQQSSSATTTTFTSLTLKPRCLPRACKKCKLIPPTASPSSPLSPSTTTSFKTKTKVNSYPTTTTTSTAATSTSFKAKSKAKTLQRSQNPYTIKNPNKHYQSTWNGVSGDGRTTWDCGGSLTCPPVVAQVGGEKMVKKQKNPRRYLVAD